MAADCVDGPSALRLFPVSFLPPELLGTGQGCPVPVEESAEAAEWNGFEFLSGAQKVRELGLGQKEEAAGGRGLAGRGGVSMPTYTVAALLDKKAGEPEVGRSRAICSSSRKRE